MYIKNIEFSFNNEDIDDINCDINLHFTLDETEPVLELSGDLSFYSIEALKEFTDKIVEIYDQYRS